MCICVICRRYVQLYLRLYDFEFFALLNGASKRVKVIEVHDHTYRQTAQYRLHQDTLRFALRS